MANTNQIKEEIEPQIAACFICEIGAELTKIKKIIGMQPDIIATKNNTLIFGEITTSGYLGGNKNNYHQGGVKKINEAFAKFSLIRFEEDKILNRANEITGKKHTAIECYFIVPQDSKFLSQIGYRNNLFEMNVMKLAEVKIPNEVERLLVSILMDCRNEMKQTKV